MAEGPPDIILDIGSEEGPAMGWTSGEEFGVTLFSVFSVVSKSIATS
jgi:hypothetical protein